MADLMGRFMNEVLSQGGDSTLPENLSDEWLGILGKQAELESSERTSELVAAIVHILFAKDGFSGNEISFSENEMFEYIQAYEIELAAEEINRRTDMTVSRPTVETIFTDRDITFE